MRPAPTIFLTLAMSCSIFGQTYTISTVAGNGTKGFSGDNGVAVSAQLFARNMPNQAFPLGSFDDCLV